MCGRDLNVALTGDDTWRKEVQTGIGSRCDPVITPEVSPLTPRGNHFLLKANLSQQHPTNNSGRMTEWFSFLYLSHLLTAPEPIESKKQNKT